MSDKKAFFIGLFISLVLHLGLLGGSGAARTEAMPPAKDLLASYLQLGSNSPAKITEPTKAPLCQSRTMDIVAHEDDDILFMNPDLARGLIEGGCTETVYMTAGDDGQDVNYWTQREHGAEAAYSMMLKQPNDWQEISIKVSGRWQVNVATLKQAPTVSLVFVRLPDGDLFGDGFASTNFVSLQKLEAGQISTLQAVDGQTSYSFDDLKSLLSELMTLYQPDQIRTQADDYPDHSDHIAVSRLVSQAYDQFAATDAAATPIPLIFYNGYPISSMPINVSGDDLTQKENAFMEYAKYDSAVCITLDQCYNASTYGLYFSRQYQAAN